MSLETVEYLGRNLHRWTIGPSSFLAAPELGARLMNWHVNLPDGSVREVVHWPEMKSYADFHKIRGGNPVLFPFSARTFDQGELGLWRDTSGARRHMPMHGFARQARFELTRVHDAGFTAALRPSEAEQQIYPYDYEFTVSYRFSALSLAVEFCLTNRDRQPIPWSAGHHFYFAVPWRDSATRADHVLRLSANRAVRQAADGKLVDAEPPPESVRLDEPGLVDRIHLNLRSNLVRLDQGGEHLTLKIGTESVPPDWATVVTWTESQTSPFYCIEPWMGPPNSPENKVGYHLVKPKQTQRFVVEVAVG